MVWAGAWPVLEVNVHSIKQGIHMTPAGARLVQDPKSTVPSAAAKEASEAISQPAHQPASQPDEAATAGKAGMPTYHGQALQLQRTSRDTCTPHAHTLQPQRTCTTHTHTCAHMRSEAPGVPMCCNSGRPKQQCAHQPDVTPVCTLVTTDCTRLSSAALDMAPMAF